MTISVELDDNGQEWGVLSGRWADRDRKMMEEFHLDGLEVNTAKGFEGTDLDFLAEAPQLKRLWVTHLNIRDISGIQTQNELLELSINTYCSTPIDFSSFPRLRRCYLEWRNGAESVFETASLESLSINRFPDRDLSRLAALRNLTLLRLRSGPLEMLNGVEHLGELRELWLLGLKKLKGVEGVDRLPRLTRLHVNGCTALYELGPLARARNLEWLGLLECGPLASLKPIAGLPNLESFYFYGTTKIDDGDMSVLLSLPKLQGTSFKNRRHYTHTKEQIERLLPAAKVE
jgi:hypothetical protein